MDFEKAINYWQNKDKNDCPRDILENKIETFINQNKVLALATTSKDNVPRCTPLEYDYKDGVFYILSEGGKKFQNLKDNPNVSFAIFNPTYEFGQIESAQFTGCAHCFEYGEEEYKKYLTKRPDVAMLPKTLFLIKIEVTQVDYVSSTLRQEGYSVNQNLICKI